MRGRRRYVVCYDIRDDKRLRRVHKVMKTFGWAMQYSVFVCDLDMVELVQLKGAIGAVINHGEDSVAWIECGDPGERGIACFTFLGVAPRLPTAGPVVF
jgi:CRISPR-associated protein Cas2